MTHHFDNFCKQLIEQQIEFVDFRFTDLRGSWHHMTFPVSAVTPALLEEGICFDGSSIATWKEINDSDTLLKPDVSDIALWMMDPFAAKPTVIVMCDVFDPATNAFYTRDPRTIAKKAEQYLIATGIADCAYFGPEAEFFIFDGVRFGVEGHQAFYELHSDEFMHRNGAPVGSDLHGYRFSSKGGYFPVAPQDGLCDLRGEMLTTLADMGIAIEKHHHEVAPAQHELGVRFGTLTRMADVMQAYKYVVKNVARTYGKTATFMPKPIYGDNGSGMHVHQSLWKGDTPLFAGSAYAGLSETALYFIGGILAHAKSLNAFTNPTTNSYKRLVPGFEAPVICAYSAQNRSAACRIPFSETASGKRVEVRFPDPTANAYLAFAAMLLAGLDGVENKIHPGAAQSTDLFAEKEKAKALPTVCGSLREALLALENDHAYLTRTGVFSTEMLEAYKSLKWQEVYAYEQHPHPIEFVHSYTA